MKELELKAYAKINLALDVLGTRPDGYHELATVMQRISLCDYVRLTWEPEAAMTGADPVTIALQTNRSYLPVDERNLAYKAARHLIDGYGTDLAGRLTISLTKKIPVAAGLAGGSSDAAAVLIGLNRMWRLGLDTRALCRIGADLGSDVAFCVLVQNTRYRAALAKGRGEILQPLRWPLHGYLVLVKPTFGVSTREVFENIDHCQINAHPDMDALLAGLKGRDAESVYQNMINVLECYTLHRYERVQQIKDILENETPAKKVLMSGSGPTVFALYGSMAEARKACDYMRGLRYEAYWATTDGR